MKALETAHQDQHVGVCGDRALRQRERIAGLRRELHRKRECARRAHCRNVIAHRVGVADLANRTAGGLAPMWRAQIELDPSQPRGFHRGGNSRRRRCGGNRDAAGHVCVVRASLAIRTRQHLQPLIERHLRQP
jgi:hypothetical protein